MGVSRVRADRAVPVFRRRQGYAIPRETYDSADRISDGGTHRRTAVCGFRNLDGRKRSSRFYGRRVLPDSER